eukprot:CAMPEP_0184679254 /NCGR_PEP_ID=MMETSP0312-20130426/2070_1 /TAXON_ID=31354 /ORGANISM="Compsopogon coeruleus, Strain SAG 36.94" /LENGTH=64 /DNA_ID=CAMNT_0027128575 /DNA_START=520 /DNA_END=714 /DNA_ORIENTATION=+
MGILGVIQSVPWLPEALQLAGLYWLLKSRGFPIGNVVARFHNDAVLSNFGLSSLSSWDRDSGGD